MYAEHDELFVRGRNYAFLRRGAEATRCGGVFVFVFIFRSLYFRAALARVFGFNSEGSSRLAVFPQTLKIVELPRLLGKKHGR